MSLLQIFHRFRLGLIFFLALLPITACDPNNLTLTLNPPAVGDKSVTLSWNNLNGFGGYKIQYGTQSANYSSTIDVHSATSYTIAGLNNGTAYYFNVVAYNPPISVASNEQKATPSSQNTSPAATLYIKNVDYNAAGQTTKVEYGNGVVTTYTYNELNLRLTRIYTVNANGEKLQDLNYKYDSVGNILLIDDTLHVRQQNFRYDELNRLVNAAAPTYGPKDYDYDQIGNIVRKDKLYYSYGENGAGPHAVTSLSDGTSFKYDANGNMIKKTKGTDVTDYFYDVENHLIQVKNNGSIIAQYDYDGDGGRTKKIASGVTTKYVGSLYEESSSRKTSYIFLGSTRVASVTNGKATYYHDDHLGGTNVLTDSAGIIKELIEYEPYGQYAKHEKYGSSEETALFYFTGKPLDDETGLYYYGARYYNPLIGRFITADTIVPYAGDSQSFNRYSYARNNPVCFVDPTGHWWFFIAAIIKFAALHPIITAGIINASVNVATNVQNIHNFFDVAKFAGIGYASGAAGIGAGNFIGPIAGKLLGTTIGAYVGMASAAGVGSFVNTMANLLSYGASFNDALTNGVLSIGPAVLLSVGTKIAFDGVGKVSAAIQKANAAKTVSGANTPIGQESTPSSLTTNVSEDVSDKQALSNRKVTITVESESIAPDGHVVESSLHSPDFIVDPSGQVFPVPEGATGPVPVINNTGNQTGVAFVNGHGGANGQVATMRIMDPTRARGSAPAYVYGYIKYENSAQPKPQGVNPHTGKTVPDGQSHYPIH